jgi:hypothetical protein
MNTREACEVAYEMREGALKNELILSRLQKFDSRLKRGGLGVEK